MSNARNLANLLGTGAFVPTNKGGTGLTSGFLNGITEADEWRVNSTISGNATPIATNLERNDTTFDKIGTGMSESSGIFSFPSTGIWLVHFHLYAYFNAAARVEDMIIQKTVNNSDYSTCSYHSFNAFGSGSFTHAGGDTSTIIDCTDTSNIKVRFSTGFSNSGNSTIAGSSTGNNTYFRFIKLGST